MSYLFFGNVMGMLFLLPTMADAGFKCPVHLLSMPSSEVRVEDTKSGRNALIKSKHTVRLAPGVYQLTFLNKPLEMMKTVTLTISEGDKGQAADVKLDIDAPGTLEEVAFRERLRESGKLYTLPSRPIEFAYERVRNSSK